VLVKCMNCFIYLFPSSLLFIGQLSCLEILLLWKSSNCHICWVCIWTLSCTAYKAHVPYYSVICSPSGCTVFFPHYVINGTIFGEKKLLNIKCAFWLFSTNSVSKFLILRITQQDIIINVQILFQNFSF